MKSKPKTKILVACSQFLPCFLTYYENLEFTLHFSLFTLYSSVMSDAHTRTCHRAQWAPFYLPTVEKNKPTFGKNPSMFPVPSMFSGTYYGKLGTRAPRRRLVRAIEALGLSSCPAPLAGPQPAAGAPGHARTPTPMYIAALADAAASRAHQSPRRGYIHAFPTTSRTQESIADSVCTSCVKRELQKQSDADTHMAHANCSS